MTSRLLQWRAFWLAAFVLSAHALFAADEGSSQNSNCPGGFKKLEESHEGVPATRSKFKIDEVLGDDARDVRLYGRKVELALEDNGYAVQKLVAVTGFSLVYLVKDPAGHLKIMKVMVERDRDTAESREKRWESLLHELHLTNYQHSSDTRFLHATARSWETAVGEKIRLLEMEAVLKEPGSTESAPDLHALLRSDSEYFTRARKESIKKQMRELLALSHRLGIWHLDLKPNNFLIAKDKKGEPVVHIIDWGLSEATFAPSPYNYGNNIFGTYGYIEPERLGHALKPTETSDVFALRFVEWYVNLGGAESRDFLTYRLTNKGYDPDADPTRRSFSLVQDDATPDAHAIPEWTYKSLPSMHDSSGFIEGFRQPGLALDNEGSEQSRNVALAEWSRIPKTLAARDELIGNARQLSPPVFLEKMGRSLMQYDDLNPPLGSLSLSTKPQAALEILSSHVLVENFDGALKLSNEEIQEVAESVAYLHSKYASVRLGRRLPSPLEPAPQLLYVPFIERYQKYALAHGLPEWNRVQAGANSLIKMESEIQRRLPRRPFPRPAQGAGGSDEETRPKL